MSSAQPTIYIVDDDRSFRTAVGELLSACGYRVALFESAEKLLQTSLASEPGCILLDVTMAGLSGLQLQDLLVKADANCQSCSSAAMMKSRPSCRP